MNDMGKQTTYQKLLAAYNKLLMENEFLHKEVDRLQALLNSKDIHITQPITKQHLSLEEKVSVFRNLFKGREDVFARRWYSRTSGKSGYQPVCRNYRGRFRVLTAGTGDSRKTMSFYRNCGFSRSHTVEDFFVKNYDHPIIEEGKALKDMVYFKRDIQ